MAEFRFHSSRGVVGGREADENRNPSVENTVIIHVNDAEGPEEEGSQRGKTKAQ